MAEKTNVLPPLTTNPTTPAQSVASLPVKLPDEIETGPTTKDVLIGSGALLVLAVIFFVVRSAYVNYLVGSLKRSPNNAGLAGWGLFFGLLFGSAIACLALISKSYFQVVYAGPLAGLSLISFVLMIAVASKK